jgi:hypothetical protein
MENRNALDSSEGWHAPLLQLWSKFLKLETISMDDDFFEMGGDSLLASDVWTELQQLAGRPLPESVVFDAPTVRAMARQLARLTGQESPKEGITGRVR